MKRIVSVAFAVGTLAAAGPAVAAPLTVTAGAHAVVAGHDAGAHGQSVDAPCEFDACGEVSTTAGARVRGYRTEDDSTGVIVLDPDVPPVSIAGAGVSIGAVGATTACASVEPATTAREAFCSAAESTDAGASVDIGRD